jgi:tRNA-specific 2-thiouridylase
VRRIAEQHDLVTHDKKDSTGICFIGERRFKDFLQQYLPAQPGRIETPEGTVIGEHGGLMYHTIGQRQGLGIGGVRGAGAAPGVVGKKDLERNVLVVVQGGDHPLLFSGSLTARQSHWINGAPPATEFRCTAKTRYRQADQDCLVKVDGDQLTVVFDGPQRAVTPGQSVVFYRDEVCLGGAVIEATE